MDSSQSDQENSQLMNGSGRKRTMNERKLAYRELLNQIEDIQETEDTGLQTVKALGDILKEVNVLGEESEISTKAGNPDETLLDCLVLSATSNVLVKCIEAVDVHACTYEPQEFSHKIKQRITNEGAGDIAPTDLLKLIGDARAIIPEVPCYQYMYGTFDINKLPEPKQKKERVREAREKLQKKEPEKVREQDKEESSIDEIVKSLFNVLNEEYIKNNRQPINYYNYIIDTDSFSNTVENMFYFSFLVRDGKAQLDLDSSGTPYIKPMSKRELKEMRDGGGTNSQVLTAISMEQWQVEK